MKKTSAAKKGVSFALIALLAAAVPAGGMTTYAAGITGGIGSPNAPGEDGSNENGGSVVQEPQPMEIGTPSEDAIEVNSWATLKSTIESHTDSAPLEIVLTTDLTATNNISVKGKTVKLYTKGQTITIGESNESGVCGFTLSSAASLTVAGTEAAPMVFSNWTQTNANNTGIFTMSSGCTLAMEYVTISGLTSKNPSDSYKGAIYATGGTLYLNHVTCKDCVLQTGLFLHMTNASALVQNCTFSNNETRNNGGGASGGVIYTAGANNTLVLENCVASNNTNGVQSSTTLYGRNATGPLNFNGGTVLLRNVESKDNQGAFGAGIRAQNTNLILENVTVSGNTSAGDTTMQSVGYHYGSGIAVWGGSLTATNTTITGNSGAWLGGGLCLLFGASATLDDTVTISNNTATIGGGIAIYDNETAEVNLNGATITNNNAVRHRVFNESGRGGGIAIMQGGKLMMQSGTISNNTAALGGGMVAYSGAEVILNGGVIQENQAVRDEQWRNNLNGTGGGIAIENGNIVMQSGTISGNTAAEMGGGISNIGGSFALTGGTITGNDALQTTVPYQGDAIFQAGSFALSGAPTLEGDVYLTDGCYIDVPAAYTGAPILVDVDRDSTNAQYLYDETYQAGRNIAIYSEDLPVPDHDEITLYRLAESIQNDGFALKNEEIVSEQDPASRSAVRDPNRRILELYRPTDADYYGITHQFVSGTEGFDLPEAVLQHLPEQHTERYLVGAAIPSEATAIQPKATSVTVPEGTWEFAGYDTEPHSLMPLGGITYTGTWHLQGNATSDPPQELPSDEQTPPSNEEPSDPATDEPASPSNEKPANPTTDEPAEPSKEEPTNPTADEPAASSKEEPVNPIADEPTTPTTDELTDEPTDEAEDPGNLDVPKTGDSTDIRVWSGLGIVATASMAAVTPVLWKRHKK